MSYRRLADGEVCGIECVVERTRPDPEQMRLGARAATPPLSHTSRYLLCATDLDFQDVTVVVVYAIFSTVL